MKFSRRGLFGFAGAAAVTAAIPTKALASIFPLPSVAVGGASSFLTINQITQDALVLFRHSNTFMQNIDAQYIASSRNRQAKQLNLRFTIRPLMDVIKGAKA